MSKSNGVPLSNEAVYVQCTRPDILPDGTKCNYRWRTKSSLGRVSCPNCGYPNVKSRAVARAQEETENGRTPC